MQNFGTEKFHGVNFAVFPHKGVLGSGEARKSMEEMAHKTHANWVILTPSGIQETPYSEEICFDGEKSCTDEELCDMIHFAHRLRDDDDRAPGDGLEKADRRGPHSI